MLAGDMINRLKYKKLREEVLAMLLPHEREEVMEDLREQARFGLIDRIRE